ncbi:hypothetical protein TWF281_004311 [Arthrobotrys megalospora]
MSRHPTSNNEPQNPSAGTPTDTLNSPAAPLTTERIGQVPIDIQYNLNNWVTKPRKQDPFTGIEITPDGVNVHSNENDGGNVAGNSQ